MLFSGRSRSPSPSGKGGRESPTPTTYLEKKRGTTVKDLMGPPGSNRVKVSTSETWIMRTLK